MNIENDLEFMNIVKNILDSDDFNKLRNIYDNTNPTHKKYYGVGFFH